MDKKPQRVWWRCTYCGDWKTISDMGKDKSRYDGVSIYCKECRREKNRANYYKSHDGETHLRGYSDTPYPCANCHLIKERVNLKTRKCAYCELAKEKKCSKCHTKKQSLYFRCPTASQCLGCDNGEGVCFSDAYYRGANVVIC